PSTTPTETYTLSLHDALPIFAGRSHQRAAQATVDLGDDHIGLQAGLADLHEPTRLVGTGGLGAPRVAQALQAAVGVVLERPGARSEEHTSELQSRENLVCRLL